MSASPSVRLAVVMERRPLDNPWSSETWLPVAVRIDAEAERAPRALGETSGVAQWLFPGLELVITSYSIHYTKLYDRDRQPGLR